MKILNTLLTLCCLGGLVSCYPVAGQNTMGSSPTAKTTPAKKQTVSANSPSTVIAKKKVTSTTETAKKQATDNVTPNTEFSDASDNATKEVEKQAEAPKPTVPTVVKTASKVPGKDGFVFNPYTHNQVDVRGIPSGTKVRDPHDANPAHVFRVP